jgi:hypothetical protein
VKLILWHGSDRSLELFTDSGPDKALHLGTRAQAEMRNRAFLYEVEVEVTRTRRSRDPGGDWSGRIRAARANGFDSIVYLNRCEPPRAKPRGFPAVSGGVEPPPTAEVFCHMVGAAAGAAGLGRRKSQRASSSAACRSASRTVPSRARNVDPERCPLSTVPVRQSVLLV